MEAWEQWRDMAAESEEAARLAEAGGCLRSAASRYYYSAYQAVTAMLVYRKVPTPEDRQAWSHDQTPDLIQEQLGPVLQSRDKRNDLTRRLQRLYKTRIVVDYMADRSVRTENLKVVRRDASYILKVAERVLPER